LYTIFGLGQERAVISICKKIFFSPSGIAFPRFLYDNMATENVPVAQFRCSGDTHRSIHLIRMLANTEQCHANNFLSGKMVQSKENHLS
jgi:hypothetical protein